MKRFPNHPTRIVCKVLSFALGLGISLIPNLSTAALVSLATQPLAASTTTTVKPNVLFVIDNSGSMAWDHMPDDNGDGGSAVTFDYGFYGYRSSQCNQVYYDPTVTYQVPITAAGADYSNSSYSGAWVDGFSTGDGTVDLRTDFTAVGEGTGSSAYYYAYSGSQTSAAQRDYHSTANTFYNECHSAQNTSPGSDVFTKVVLGAISWPSTTTAKITPAGTTSTSVSSITIDGVELMSGTSTASSTPANVAANIAAKITLNGFAATEASGVVTITGVPNDASKIVITRASGSMTFSPTIYQKADATKQQNFANWYSYYRTRMLMMKTSAGRAFSKLDGSYRVGLMKISASSTPDIEVGAFESTKRSDWFDSLYGLSASGSTPLREALSNAGLYYAGKLSATDPVQYSCQQNFTILSTDGYWNTGAGFQLDGSTPVGNQDASLSRPMYDGAVALGTSTVTITFTRDSYTCGGCGSSTNSLRRQSQIGSCTVSVTGTPSGSETCTPGSWSNNGTRVDGACVSNAACSASLPSPNPSAKVESERNVTADVSGGSSDSLSDVAAYYYNNDLRTSGLGNCTGAVAGENVCTNNVFTSSSDTSTKQHMTTFTLGLGASGRMIYSSSYLKDTSGDYYSVKLGSTASSSVCTWQSSGTVCNWPIPGMSSSNGLITNIDDLWHSAVNGHGAYFSATSPTTLARGLANALTGLNSRRGSAAAAATSTLNPVAGNNFAYIASYTTVSWRGNLEARGINTETGAVNENASWCLEDVPAGDCKSPGSVVSETDGDTTTYYCKIPDSVTCAGGILDGTYCKVPVATSCTGTMKSLVFSGSDTRNIYTSNGETSPALIAFDTAYATANPSYFNAAQIGTLSQWSSLTTTQQTTAAGANLLKFLRGQTGYEDRTSNAENDRLYRSRDAVLGDALESQPAFMGPPVFNYPYSGYSAFKAAKSGRAASVFMGTNDGMMHSFDAANGAERWAYVPSMVIPQMWKLADKNYATLHANYVNGSPITSDICSANCTTEATAVWKTILVAGLNGGGRGFYALDITDPATPILLWELTTTSGIGKVKDDDVGYSFGQPVITRLNSGQWVVLVTSGYNNSEGDVGNGQGYLYVLNANTGAIISKIGTGAGDTTTPSGLAKIVAWNLESVGNRAGYVYGGDLLGNLWRFDINSAATAAIGTGSVMKLAAVYSDASATNPQPIMTTPALGLVKGKRVVYVGTGKYLETGDLTTNQKQSIYAIKDDDATTSLSNPRSTLVAQTLTNNTNGTATRTGSANAVNMYSGRGWYVDLPDTGERVNIDPRLVQGVLLVASIVPTSSACAPGGYGWLNFFDYETGAPVDLNTNLMSTKFASPIVGINVLYIQGEPVVEVVTASNPTPTKDDNVTFKAAAPTFTGKRVSWRELLQ